MAILQPAALQGSILAADQTICKLQARTGLDRVLVVSQKRDGQVVRIGVTRAARGNEILYGRAAPARGCLLNHANELLLEILTNSTYYDSFRPPPSHHMP